MRSVLLVHPDADAWLAPLALDAEVTTAATAQGARAYLAGTAFDLVLVGEGVEGAEAIAALRDVLGLATPVETVADAPAVARRLGGARPAAPASAPAPGAPAAGGRLDHVARELSRVAHALNNPLAVIAGNAQLALEVARAMGTDETVVDALGQIQAAAGELEALFGEVAALRAVVEAAVSGGPAT